MKHICMICGGDPCTEPEVCKQIARQEAEIDASYPEPEDVEAEDEDDDN